MVTFTAVKKRILSRKDKSVKGSFDRAIAPLCSIINSLPQYCTTSSCAGRIALLSLNQSFKKNRSINHVVSHDVLTAARIREAAAAYKSPSPLWLRSEPFIVHIACGQLANARCLLGLAHRLGLRRSGIIPLASPIIVEITGTEKMDMPLVYRRKMLPEDEYLEIIVAAANERLVRTRKKLENFQNAFSVFASKQ